MLFTNDARFPFTILACLPWSFASCIVWDVLRLNPAFCVRRTHGFHDFACTDRFLCVLYAEIGVNATAASPFPEWSAEGPVEALRVGPRCRTHSKSSPSTFLQMQVSESKSQSPDSERRRDRRECPRSASIPNTVSSKGAQFISTRTQRPFR